jgi:hypothetical protein
MAHRHKDSRAKWTTTDDEPAQFTDAEVKALKLLLVASGGGGTTPLPPNDPPPPDVTAPNFTATVFGAPTQTTIPFTWTTDEAAKVLARYGTTTAMASSTALSGSFATSGGDTITGLTAGTLYYVRLDAVDAAGNTRQGSVRTITTAGTVVVPPPPPPPPPLTGTVVNPGEFKQAVLDGETDIILRGFAQVGPYRESFGATQQTNSVSVRNYPGELPVIDGTGLALQNFLYIGTGNWHWTGCKIQGFRPTNSGVMANKDGTLTLDAMQIVGVGPVKSDIQLVYGFGTGTTTIRGSHLWNAPGAAWQAYTGSPVGIITDTVLGGLYRGAFVYNGTTTFTRVTFEGPGPYDIERQAPGNPVYGADTTGTGPGGSVLVLNV